MFSFRFFARIASCAIGFSLAISLPLAIAQAQQAAVQSVEASEISGLLEDSSGAVIAGGNVVLISPDGKSMDTTSQNDGTFVFQAVTAGISYKLSATALGMNKVTRENVVARGQLLVVAMQIDQLQQTITVFANSPELDTTPVMSRTLDPATLGQLPSTNRNLAQFAMVDPRARNTVGSGSDGRSSTRLTINNQSFRFTQYELDGSTDSDFILSNGPQQNISISAIGEFKLLSNQYLAQYGRSSGGVILLSTKSGTDQHHGEVFGLVRPSGIQAAPPFRLFTFQTPRSNGEAPLEVLSNVGKHTISAPMRNSIKNAEPSFNRQHRGSLPEFRILKWDCCVWIESGTSGNSPRYA